MPGTPELSGGSKERSRRLTPDGAVMDRTGTDLTMTFSSPDPGRRATRRGHAIRSAAAVAATLGLLAPLPAGAATTTDDTGEVALTMAPGNQGIVTPGEQVVITLNAANAGDEDLEAGEVTLERGVRRLSTEAALDTWLDTGVAPGSFVEIAASDIDPVASQAETALTLAIEDTDTGTDDLAAGVYPIRATYRSGEQEHVAESVLVSPQAAGTAGVGVIVPITAGALTTGLIGAGTLSDLTGPDGSLSAQLDAVSGTSAILAVDPAIAASIRALGSSAPDDAVDWLDRLLALPNDRFALQFGDADLATQVGAGVTTPLQMTSFAPYLDPADFTVAASGEQSPTPAPSVTLPTVDELLDIGATHDDLYWPATGTAGAEVAATLGGAATVVVPDSVVTTESAVARATADDASLLVYDAEMSAALQEASETSAPVDRSAQLAALTAHAMLSAHSGALLVTVDRVDGRSAEALRDAILAVAGLPSRFAVDLDALLATDPTPVSLESVPADPERVAALTGYLDAAADLEHIATVLDDPALLLSNERATQLQLLGNAWLSSPEEWTDAATAHQRRVDAWSDGVALVPGQDISLYGSNATLPFTVRNDLPWPATVTLTVVPNDARLVVQESTTVVIGAEQTSRVEVPVEALIGSGVSSIDLQLRTPNGRNLGDGQTYAVSVEAEWETPTMVALSVLVTALLVLGIVRTVRRHRRGEVRSDGRSR